MATGDRYKAGTVKVHIECNANCYVEDDDEFPYHDDGMELGTAQLPHQCGAWVVGGPDEIQALISDLQGALMKLDPLIVSTSSKRERYNQQAPSDRPSIGRDSAVYPAAMRRESDE